MPAIPPGRLRVESPQSSPRFGVGHAPGLAAVDGPLPGAVVFASVPLPGCGFALPAGADGAELGAVEDTAPGAGVVQAAYVTLTRGVALSEPTPEAVAAQYAEITDRAGEIVPQSGAEQAMTIMQRLQGQ